MMNRLLDNSSFVVTSRGKPNKVLALGQRSKRLEESRTATTTITIQDMLAFSLFFDSELHPVALNYENALDSYRSNNFVPATCLYSLTRRNLSCKKEKARERRIRTCL
jgi:hypothetical protein